MKRGTKSLLFGCHQFILHPLTVVLAWHHLYHRWPTWRELVCIIVHDWGYWGCEHMDQGEGAVHPYRGANVVYRLFGLEYFYLCLYHSRHMTKELGNKPVSALYYADKLSFVYTPWWLYVCIGVLTGEIFEYVHQTTAVGMITSNIHNSRNYWKSWHWEVKKSMVRLSRTPDAVPYLHD